MFDKIRNYLLVKKYPFLRPRNNWTGKYVEDYDYSWTELDFMPRGWRKAFGLQMCEEIKQALLKTQKENPDGGYYESYITNDTTSDKVIPYLEGYTIVQIKEKYGELRWYDNGAPKEVLDIISKYEDLSYRTCIKCGASATKISKGWVSPYCDKCAKKINEEYEDIKE